MKRIYGGATRSQKAETVEIARDGGSYLTSGTTTGRWSSIHALSAAVLTVLSDNSEGNLLQGTLTGLPIPAGDTIYGTFTSITVWSGAVIAYA
jgi:hypothetical protein